MPRTTAALVKSILLRDYDSLRAPDLTPFIEAANLLVTRVEECALAKGITLTADELEMIERWLAAHSYALNDRIYTSKHTADASASFGGQMGLGLDFTPYGQWAARLDISGCLEALAGAERKVGRAYWLGKPKSDQIDYVDRD